MQALVPVNDCAMDCNYAMWGRTNDNASREEWLRKTENGIEVRWYCQKTKRYIGWLPNTGCDEKHKLPVPGWCPFLERMTPEEYDQQAEELAARWPDSRSPTISPCRDCGRPYPHGYICSTCGLDNSVEGEE